ncbi:MSF1-domain-containing protein [Hysterangium stoloniferum]|nr:MSF1-domain-containing protein [Hysterangium stoloniferum]
MKWYSQSFSYDDPWATVALAYFLRYPNPHASHIISCDVISRNLTSEGTMKTSRLILKRGILPKWAPRGIISRAESWVIEESEVDPEGKTVQCVTRNLDHVKVLQVIESVALTDAGGRTVQRSEARVISRFGWGLARRIESLGVNRFKSHLEKSREGISLVLRLIHESRLQPFSLASTGTVFDRPLYSGHSYKPPLPPDLPEGDTSGLPAGTTPYVQTEIPPTWRKFKAWFHWR